MRRMGFSQAIEDAVAQAMADDTRIVLIGEDVRMIRVNLFSRFGPDRVLNTPISEAAFVGAAVAAAMAGLRPIVEIMLVDFIGTAMDAILNHASRVRAFSGGRWNAPLVIRTACGGGYGDGGQHEQSLWGWLAHIPGLSVVVPSTPADARRAHAFRIECGRSRGFSRTQAAGGLLARLSGRRFQDNRAVRRSLRRSGRIRA